MIQYLAPLFPVQMYTDFTINTQYDIQDTYFYELKEAQKKSSNFLSVAQSSGSYDFYSFLMDTGVYSYQLILSPNSISSPYVI